MFFEVVSDAPVTSWTLYLRNGNEGCNTVVFGFVGGEDGKSYFGGATTRCVSPGEASVFSGKWPKEPAYHWQDKGLFILGCGAIFACNGEDPLVWATIEGVVWVRVVDVINPCGTQIMLGYGTCTPLVLSRYSSGARKVGLMKKKRALRVVNLFNGKIPESSSTGEAFTL